MKKYVATIIIAISAMLAFTGCGDSSKDDTKETKKETQTEMETEAEDLLSGKHNVEIDIKDYGKISVELDTYLR